MVQKTIKSELSLRPNARQKCAPKILAAGLSLLLFSCDNASTAPAKPFDAELSGSFRPADAALAEIYERSCKSCHTLPETGAPLTGDQATWRPRIEKGMDTLLDNVINGSEGMPPLGLCMDCEPEEFEALIKFMAQTEGRKE